MNKLLTEQEIQEYLYDSPYPWWQWDVPANTVEASPRKAEMLGYDYRDFMGKGYQSYTDLLHPEDFERAMTAMRELMEGKAPIYQVDYRIKAADGSWHWYMDRGAIVAKMPDNQIKTIRGLVFDVGSTLEQGTLQSSLVQQLREAVFGSNKTGKALTVCSNCRKIKIDGQWMDHTARLEDFITVRKSHSVCFDCLRLLYPNYADAVIQSIENK